MGALWENLRRNLEGEILSGLLAGLAVAPIVAMVDKAVFSAASGKMPYKQSFKECGMMLLIDPPKFFQKTTFKWCFAVYASTFVTANCIDRIARLGDMNVQRTTFLAVSAVNITLNVSKDKFLTQKHALPEVVGRPLPKVTLLCYAIKDIITMYGAFICIEPVTERVQKYVLFNGLAKLITQTVCPIISQLLNTPFLIYGVDVYNRPFATWQGRLLNIKKYYWDTYYWSRVARVGPAYSVGGVLNLVLRYIFTESLPKDKDGDDEDQYYYSDFVGKHP